MRKPRVYIDGKPLEAIIANNLGKASLALSVNMRIMEKYHRTTEREYHALRGLYEHITELELDLLNSLHRR